MKETIAAVAGFFIAPTVCGVIFAVLGLLPGQGLMLGQEGVGDLPMAFLAGYEFSLAAALVLGVPVFLVLRFLKLIRWWSALAGGIAIGAFVGAAFQWPGYGHLPFETWLAGTVHNAVIMGAMGAAAAFVFWLIWKQGSKRRAGKTPMALP